MGNGPQRSISVVEFPIGLNSPTTPTGNSTLDTQGTNGESSDYINGDGGGEPELRFVSSSAPDGAAADVGAAYSLGGVNGVNDAPMNGSRAGQPEAGGQSQVAPNDANSQSDAAAGGSGDHLLNGYHEDESGSAGEPSVRARSNVKTQCSRVKADLLGPIDEPAPSDWIVLEDDFMYFVAYYLCLLGPDTIVDPDCLPDEGCINLQFIRSGISRSRLLQILLAQETGSHVNMSEVETIKVKAFRLEPLTGKGHISVGKIPLMLNKD